MVDAEHSHLEVDPMRSERDLVALPKRLEAWLRSTTGDDGATVGELSTPSGSGMSSETMLFDAVWSDGDGRHERGLVARIEPRAEDMPVFPTYDLAMQFKVMGLVRDNCDAPVPRPLWLEADPAAIGSPFFVMEQAAGRVPADIPPYPMEGWLLDASQAEQRLLQKSSVETIAQIHSIDLRQHDVPFLTLDHPGANALERHMNYHRWLYDWVRDGRTNPLIEDTFAWLDARWPTAAAEGRDVISWGDARIGNMMYESDGFRPVAVLDWEMAAIGPPEIDLAWISFLHTFFQDIIEVFEMPGMPNFMQPAEVVATYEAATDHTVQDFEWFIVYAALRHAIIISRVYARQVHFGEREWDDDPDAHIYHAARLRQLIS